MKRKREFIVVSDNASNKRLAKSSLVQSDIAMKKAAAQVRLANTLANRSLQRNGNLKRETGYVDLASQTAPMNTTGSIGLLATVAQGAAVNQRVGKKIRWESIQLRGFVQAASACVITKVSMIIVYDKRPTGSLPAVTDVLVSPSSNSLNNDNNSGRFQILRRVDWVIAGSSTAPISTDSCIQVLDEFIKVRRPGIFKSAGTGAIGDIEEGCLYALWVGDKTGTAAGTVVFDCRVRFTDL